VAAKTTGCAGATVRLSAAVVAAGATPFLAVTAKVLTPAVVGVPLRAPEVLSLSPAGNDPEHTVIVGAGVPEAVNLYEPGVPTEPEAGGVLAVKAGATDARMTEAVSLL
jgi:hypothetical protein